MRRTRIKMMAAVMAATMLLGGCGDALYDLTDDEENVSAYRHEVQHVSA